MRLRKTPAAIAALGAATALVIAGCSSSGSSTAGSTSSSAAPAQLTVWRMGSSTPAQVTWMTSVVSQFHKDYPAYAKTKVNVQFIPWTNRTSDWTNALSSGKNAPDITELGNTDTPTEASLGMLANITSDVNAWSNKSNVVSGMLANDTQSGTVYAVPWFGGVRGIWYRTDQFKAAGIASPPATWAQLVTDAKKLMAKYPGTYGLGAPTYDSPAVASFIWGAGGQIATQQNGKWVAQLTSPQSEAGIKFYVDLYLTNHVSPAKYIGQTELGNVGATSGGPNEDFALGKLDMYIDGPWASGTFPANAVGKSSWASFPIPSENGPNPAPVFSGGSDLAVWSGSKFKTGRLGPSPGHGLGAELHVVRQLTGLLPALHVAAHRRLLLQQPAALGLRQGGDQQPDRPAERQELGHGGRDRPDPPHDDEAADEGGQLHLHGGRGQHPAAERPQQRQPGLAG